jgi:hypothetical protein
MTRLGFLKLNQWKVSKYRNFIEHNLLWPMRVRWDCTRHERKYGSTYKTLRRSVRPSANTHTHTLAKCFYILMYINYCLTLGNQTLHRCILYGKRSTRGQLVFNIYERHTSNFQMCVFLIEFLIYYIIFNA